MDKKAYVQEYIDRARKAQEIFAEYPQEKVDEAVRAIGKVIYDNAEELAKTAIDETGMGVYEDKIAKNKGKSKATWAKLKGVKSRGIIKYIDDQALVEIAKPIGVIGCVPPTTNPTMTPMHNAMIALKGGNAIIVSPHPNAIKTGVDTVNYMRQALTDIGAPVDLIQIIEDTDLEISGHLMAMCDTCISTGGPFMVKAAFSSGKPAFGVGAGNNQVLVDRGMDIADVVKKVVAGRTYDNGVLCTCEQAVYFPSEDYDKAIEEYKKLPVFVAEDPADAQKIREYLFKDGALNKKVVGRDATVIAEAAGVEVPADTKMLLVPITGDATEEVLAKEKLCPVQVAYSYINWEDAVKIAHTNLTVDGQGHSVTIHSNDKEKIEAAALTLPVSRFSINQQGSSSLGGTLTNGLNPTATLGCGSWGNNSISENLWWHHLVNISRIAYVIPGKVAPTDEEIWG